MYIHTRETTRVPQSDEYPASPLSHDTKATSTSSPKRRRGMKKRVVHVPIKEVDGYRLKGETNAPPSDSWAWRKYGQKPIKGSPYPRGYYRCSSCKGCPARKQVERSRTDPSMVIVTYSCEHNHPWAASRSNIQRHRSTPPSPSPSTTTEASDSNISDEQLEEEPAIETVQSELEHEPEPHQKFTSVEVGSTCGPFATTTDQYHGWISDLDSTSPTMLESPLMAEESDHMSTTIFSIGKDEESFFADLDELPECTTVFRPREKERSDMMSLLHA